MSVDSREMKIKRCGYLLKQPPRLGNGWHVAPDPFGLPISGPVKSHGAEACIGKQGSCPVVAGGMVPEAVEDQYLPFFRPDRMPLAHPNVLPEGSRMKNAVADLALGHVVTLAEVLKYSSCG